MIAWISEWLQNIILIVLLATFADLLLPSSTMQKYTKMVFGLLVIVVMISPVLELFTDEFGFERLIKKVEADMNNDHSVNTIKTDIQSQSKDLNYEENMISQVENTMTTQLKQLIEGKYPVLVKNVKLNAKRENQSWQLNKVVIYLEKKTLQNEASLEAKANVDIVKEVEVDINNVQIGENNSEKQEVKEQNSKSSLNRLVTEIVNVIENEWGLNKDQVEVYIN